MAAKSKLGLLGRIGGHKKNKQSFQSISQSYTPIIDQIQISDDYCLPPDCEDDDLYSEPVDSLNAQSASGDASPVLGSSVPSQQLELSDSGFEPIAVAATTASHLHSSTAGLGSCCSIDTHNTSSSSTSNSRMSPMLSASAQRQVQLATSPSSASYMVHDITASVKHNNNTTHHRDMHMSSPPAGSPSSNTELEALHAIYVNESQLRKEEMKRNHLSNPSSTPDQDPMNAEIGGDEYDCPWDLKDIETEVYELVKQVKQKQSPSVSSRPTSVNQDTSPQHRSRSPGSPGIAAKQSNSTISPTASTSHADVCDASSNSFYRPKLHTTKQRMNSTGNMSSVVLVEGEWREARNPVAISVSPTTPELNSPLTIVSSHSPSGSNHSSPGSNAASNIIYDQKGDSEIPSRLRFADDRSRAPCAQPRGSVSSLHSVTSQDSVYLNYNEAKKKSEHDCVDDFYDDPWNVEQAQQDLMDKIHHQHSRHSTLTSSDRKKTEQVHAKSVSSSAAAAVSSSRLHNLRHETHASNQRSLPTRSLSSEKINKIDKLSPRAVGATGLHKPSSGSSGSIAAPPLPKSGPGQAHANKTATTKPVLVVQRTSHVPSVPEHRMATSGSNRSSYRKNSSSSDVPECQHRVGLGVNRSIPLSQQLWYHGCIQRNYAEELLRRQPDGCFLVRDTTGSLRDKTLSLKNSSGFIHIKIVQQPDGTFILGQFSHPFKSIMEMVEYYSRHKVNIKGAEHTYLEIPVMKET